MDEDKFHRMMVAQQQFNMAYMNALEIQATSKNGVMIEAAWDRVYETERYFKKIFDEYINYMQEMEVEFV